MEDCPLPEVAQALSPFIQPRDEVVSIRRELQAHLQEQLGVDETPLSSLNLAATRDQVIDPPVVTLSGVRKAYWKALQAHTQAQNKYEALRAELNQIKYNGAASSKDDINSSNLPTDGYISLLRQREKHRKLKVIDRALVNISSTEGTSGISGLDDMVRKKTGDAPTPPISQPSFSRSPEVEVKVMELKKAIVSTKRRTAEQKTRTSPSINGTRQPTSQGEIAGLQKALQELTAWMENQLTLIANAEADAQDVRDDSLTDGTPADSQASMEDIEVLYEQYLETRQQLVETVNDDAIAKPNTNGLSFDSQSSGSRIFDIKTSTKSSAEVLLPFIPTLIAAKQTEQALLQQTSHTRKQVTAAEDDMSYLIERFAGESHLVQPGAAQGQDWAVAGIEAAKATEDFIKGRLDTGEHAVHTGKATLDTIQNLPQSMDRVVD
jgi:hypothetical protein